MADERLLNLEDALNKILELLEAIKENTTKEEDENNT